jgi:hypothetical protein
VASGTFLPATCNLPLAAVSSGEKLKTLTKLQIAKQQPKSLKLCQTTIELTQLKLTDKN